MKQITNWRQASVADFEADGLLDTVTKMHVMSYQVRDLNGELGKVFTIRRDHENYIERVAKFFKYHIDKKIPVVMHNGIGYDVKMVEKILGLDLSELMVIDSLATSWYLSPERRLHGLDSFFEDYGIAKPTIEHWEQQEGETLEEFLDKMEHRCGEDVKINTALWKDHEARLIDMYTMAQHLIDNGQTIEEKGGIRHLNVGGTRMSPDEWIPIDDMIGRSVDHAIDSILTFLMFKMDCAALQETTRWEVDVEHCRQSLEKLEAIVLEAREGLAAVMPVVPKYVKKTQPKADPFKKNGDRAVHWVKWDETMRKFEEGEKDPESGAPLVYIDPDDALKDGLQVYRVWSENEAPNPGSPVQVKDFLFSKGWVPQTFKYEKDEAAFNAWVASKPEGKRAKRKEAWDAWKAARPEERAIPQISVGGDDGKELCHSLIELAEEVPAIKVYADYKVAENRRNVLKGFFRDMEDGKFLKARIGGFTNTLRVQHRELVNLPGVDKPYGYDIRGALIAGVRKILAGSDMSSLEDRVKHHFMLPHDPEYVATMQADDFDPHILMALTAGMVTQKEFDDFKRGEKSANAKAARKKGKTTNYASVYNAGAAKIAQAAGVPLEEGQRLHKAYWELNWSVKEIADEQVVFKDSRGNKWLINPVNGFCYSLRKESDRFSTLAQGTGSFFFDMWVDNILTAMVQKWGAKAKRLTGSFHDECIICLGDSEANREALAAIIKNAVNKVNEDFGLRRKLDCETQFGQRYSDIH